MIVATSGAGTAFPSTTLGHSPLLVGFILLIFLSFFFFYKDGCFSINKIKIGCKIKISSNFGIWHLFMSIT
jgi:hypothetical protein